MFRLSPLWTPRWGPVLAGGEAVVVDLTEVTFAESALLGCLIVAGKRGGREGFAVVVPPKARRREMFDVTGAAAFFAVFPTCAAAIKWCRRPPLRLHYRGFERWSAEDVYPCTWHTQSVVVRLAFP
jgi:hypothetical protein